MLSRLKEILSDFSEKLVAVREDLHTPSGRSARGRGSENHPDTEQEEEVISSPEFKSELVLLSNAVEKVKESLESRDASDHDIQQEDSDAEDTSGVQVCTCGPPGTEPVLSAGFSSMTRYDKNKSVVYSRVSAGAGLLSGHTPSRVQLLSIPPKDSPHVRGEVYAVIDQSCPRRRHRSRGSPDVADSGDDSADSPMESSGPSSPTHSDWSHPFLADRPPVRRSQRLLGAAVKPVSVENSLSTADVPSSRNSIEDSKRVRSSVERNDSSSPTPSNQPSFRRNLFADSDGTRETTPTGVDTPARASPPTKASTPSTRAAVSTVVRGTPVKSVNEIGKTTVEGVKINQSPLPAREVLECAESRISLLHTSTDEYFSAEEDVEMKNGVEEDVEKNGAVAMYNADPGGSISCENGQDMIATNISVTTGQGFVGQASSDDDSQVDQQQPGSWEKEGEGEVRLGEETSSYGRVRSDVQEWVNATGKPGKKGGVRSPSKRSNQTILKVLASSNHATPTKLSIIPKELSNSPPLPLSSPPPLLSPPTLLSPPPLLSPPTLPSPPPLISTKAVLTSKTLRLDVPKLPHKCLSRELNKLKASSRSSSPFECPPLVHDEEESASGLTVSVKLDDNVQLEDTGGGEEGKEDAAKGAKRLKPLKKKDFVKPLTTYAVVVKAEPDISILSPPPGSLEDSFPLGSSSGEYNLKSPSCSSYDDITFSDVASNAMKSPTGSSRTSKERSLSREPAASKKATHLSQSQVTGFQWGSDEDFDTTKSAHVPSSGAAKLAAKKKKRKLLRRVSSDDDETVIARGDAEGKDLKSRTHQKNKGQSTGGNNSSDDNFLFLDTDDDAVKREPEDTFPSSPTSTNRTPPHKATPTPPRSITTTPKNSASPSKHTPSPSKTTPKKSPPKKSTTTDPSTPSPTDPLSPHKDDSSPFKVNIQLKHPVKLGKHSKGPHSKGKEKAKGPPKLVQCLSCGRDVDWKNQSVHAHPRLNVLTCQSCFKRWNTGSFDMEGGHEIYCLLCGDGGNIVLCDYCDKVFCEACISRISGPDHLQHLLESDSAAFCCYLCDSTPIDSQQELCVELTGYFSKASGRGLSRSRLINKGLPGGGSGMVGGARGVVKHGDASGSSSGADVGQTGEGKEGGKNKTRRSRLAVSDSSDDLWSESGGGGSNSTDDLDLSDTLLASDDWTRSRVSRTKNKDDKVSDLSSRDSKSEETEPREKQQSEGKGKKKKKRRRIEPLMSISSGSSDEDQPEATETRKTRKRKTAPSHSDSSSAAELQKKEVHKRKRLIVSLSSSSGEEDAALRVKLSPGPNSDSDKGTAAGEEGSESVGRLKYRMTQIFTSDSSDFDLPQGKKRTRGDLSTSPSENTGEGRGNDEDGRGSEEKPKETKKKRRRVTRSSKKEAVEIYSSEEDFIERTFHARGHKKQKSKLNRSFLSSDSDSNSDSDVQAITTKKEGEEEEEEEEASQDVGGGKKRKNIRKVKGEDKLTSETRQAQKEEEARVERLKKRKSLDKDKQDDRLVLEEDPKSKEVKVEVRKCMVSSIKPHQREGIKFLYDACVETLDRFKTGKMSGAILAHCMGLGKTLQVIAFADALLNCEDSGVKKVLVLCPVNTVNNWRAEFYKWIPFMHCDYNVYILNDVGVKARLDKLRKWFVNGGVVFMGYDMFRNLAISKRTKKKKNREDFQKFLLDPGADMVVCDEGHVMRNSKSSLSLVVNRVKSRLRIVLTGTPLQNNLLEYYTMVNFVKPNLLGSLKEFKNRFVNPITNGQCCDSTPMDIRKMKYMSHVLHTLLKDTVQRRDFRVLAKVLPPKQEYVLKIRLSDVQDKLYRSFLEEKRGRYCASDLFSTYAALAKVWNHPWVLKMDEHRKSERELAMSGEDEDASLEGFIVYGSEDESVSSKSTSRRGSACVVSGPQSRSLSPIVISSGEDDRSFSTTVTVKKEGAAGGTQAKDGQSASATNQQKPSSNSKQSPWYEEFITDTCEDQLDLSGKLLFLLELLEHARQNKEKVLVFSQSLLTLDLIEEFLSKPQYGDWVPALDYYRLDGSTKADTRTANMSDFNKIGNNRLRLFLISTRAGSLGVNLVAANRVVIFDACWNPSHDLQAIFRAYRYGQDKPVFVYRLVAQGTMEEKIYDRQVTKQSLSMRVVDEKQIGRHFSSSDLAELFLYSPAPPPPPAGSTQAEPDKRPDEDMVLCQILDKLEPAWVTSYHEHDSLLEHIDDEELSEEERRAAWANYNQQIQTNKYDFQGVQDELQAAQNFPVMASLQGVPMGATLSGGAFTAIANGQNATNVFNAVTEMGERIIHHVKQMKLDVLSLKQMKAMDPQLLTPDAQQLLKNKEIQYQILARFIELMNEKIAVFKNSRLGTSKPVVAVVERLGQVIRLQLEELNTTWSSPINGPAIMPPGTTIAPPQVVFPTAPPPHMAMAPNIGRPPLPGTSQTGGLGTSQTAPHSLSDNQVSSTTNNALSTLLKQ